MMMMMIMMIILINSQSATITDYTGQSNPLARPRNYSQKMWNVNFDNRREPTVVLLSC